MNAVKQPYEVLFRWSADGLLAGAHVRWRYITRENGKIVAESVSGAQPVGVGETDGFPLEDILNKVHEDALATVNALIAENRALHEAANDLRGVIQRMEARHIVDQASLDALALDGPAAVQAVRA